MMTNMIYDGFNFDSIKGFTVEDIRRSLLPTLTISTVHASGDKGDIFRSSSVGRNRVDVDIRIIADSRKELNEKVHLISCKLLKDKPSKLELRDEPNRYNMAILDGEVAINKVRATGFMTLPFLIPDGMLFDNKETKSTTNIGNIDAPWVLKGKIVNKLITIINSKTLEKVTINAKDAVSGDKITINFGEETVFINNRLAMTTLSAESDFWELQPGENPYTVSGLIVEEVLHRARWY